ncbi:hypothetical protein [Coralloluteibacterium thermophilus]|uniref:Uncharacterized protein n=1 Tax=Coralloluteibacterium thermophilum TaxID=2707049 RepID=A0ABV9NFI2_9GAMM
MTRRRPSAVEVARQLAHMRAAIAECGRHHDEREIREAARHLGREGCLPDRQLQLAPQRREEAK